MFEQTSRRKLRGSDGRKVEVELTLQIRTGQDVDDAWHGDPHGYGSQFASQEHGERVGYGGRPGA